MQLRTDQISAASGYLPGLDGLRAISIALVLIGHFWLADAGGVAALGVYVFFSISGFLITRLLLIELKSTSNIHLAQFYMRRFLRLYPVLIAFMVVVIIASLLSHLPTPINEIGSVFVYYVNYLIAYREVHQIATALPIGVLWSLAVEEHFYFIIPLFLMLTRGRLDRLAWFVGLMIVLPLLARFAHLILEPELLKMNVVYRLSHTRFDSIAWGVLIALLCELKGRERIIAALSSRWALVIGLGLLGASFASHNLLFRNTFGFTLRSMASVPLICAGVFGRRVGALQWVLNAPPMVWLGRLSYSVYIWHGGTHWLLNRANVPVADGLAGAIELTAAAILLASASYYLIERPALTLKRFISPRATGA